MQGQLQTESHLVRQIFAENSAGLFIYSPLSFHMEQMCIEKIGGIIVLNYDGLYEAIEEYVPNLNGYTESDSFARAFWFL